MDNVIVIRTGVLGTWREKFAGIAAFAKTAEWRLQPVDARASRPDVRRLLDFWEPCGAIVDASGAPARLRPEDFGSLPVVFMTPEDEPSDRAAPAVASDSAAIAKLALGELLSLNPASLVFVEWYEPRGWSTIKREAMRSIARMHGLPFAAIAPAPGDAEDSTRLERRIAEALTTLARPCGVFAATDAIGALVLSAAARIGADVPADIAVVAVDDDPEVCENCAPPLSSVRPDFHRLGFAAGALLREVIEGDAEAMRRRVVVAPLGLVRRASTRALRRPDRKVAEALERIRLHACDGLRPGEIADSFGASRRMAEMRFKAATGRTIGEEILQTRLSAACDYLLAGKTSVSAIANFCGWESDLAFRKVFKARFGAPPLRWAAAHARRRG